MFASSETTKERTENLIKYFQSSFRNLFLVEVKQQFVNVVLLRSKFPIKRKRVYFETGCRRMSAGTESIYSHFDIANHILFGIVGLI